MTNASGGGSTIQDPEGFKNPRETRRGIHWASGSTVIAAVIRAVVGSLGRAYLGVAIGADRDDERANREFLRTQRIALYGDYLAAVDETRVLMEPFCRLTNRTDPVRRPSLPKPESTSGHSRVEP